MSRNKWNIKLKDSEKQQSKNLLSEKKIDESLTRVIKKKRVGTNNTRNDRYSITTDSTDIKRRITEYYEQVYVNKFSNF